MSRRTKEHKKDDLRDARRRASDAAEAECGHDERDHKKGQSPTKHDYSHLQ
jgi:hypothetical protein